MPNVRLQHNDSLMRWDTRGPENRQVHNPCVFVQACITVATMWTYWPTHPLSMSASTQKKKSSTPNPNVSIEDYRKIEVDWLRTVDGNLQLHLGPQLCKKQAAANAGHLMRVHSLLMAS